MSTEQDFTRNGWEELQRFGRFIVYEDPSGTHPLARLNTATGVAVRHSNENMGHLEFISILVDVVEHGVPDGSDKDSILGAISNLVPQSGETVDPT